jgi:hypothetical protein
MPDEYTPSDHRPHWTAEHHIEVNGQCCVRGAWRSNFCEVCDERWPCATAKWLAAHDAQVKAEAWDEGFARGKQWIVTAGSHRVGSEKVPANPYRAAELRPRIYPEPAPPWVAVDTKGTETMPKSSGSGSEQ